MNANVGGIDRTLRIIAGGGLVGLAVAEKIGVWGWIGVVPLATALISWCPIYAMIGFKTLASPEENEG